jgi:hypothetical protein
LTYPQTGANGTATSAVLTSVGYNNYVIYCGAETVAPPPVTLNVYNQPLLDGTLNLEPNNCNWTTGDAVQQPNFYSASTSIYFGSASGFTPNIANVNTASTLSLSGMAFSAANYFTFQTGDTPSSMAGYGGLIYPRTGFDTGNEILGTLINMHIAPPNDGGVIAVGCPEEGCANAYNSYRPLAYTFNGGAWYSTFDPRTGNMNYPHFGIGGSQQISGVQGTTGTQFAATTGTFTNGNLRSTNSTGDEVDSGVASSNVPLLNTSNSFTAPQSMPSVKTTVYTVSTLPSASSLPAGTQVTVSDDSGLPTSNTCTGSGTEYAIAITNGTSWTCH